MSHLESEEKTSLETYQEDLCETLNLLDLKTDIEVVSYLTTLPLEILYQIFEICELRDQLILAKVCKLFRQIIRHICQKKYQLFHYNYLTFKYTLKLQNWEISELCYLCGGKVERIRFSTYFNMDLLKHIEWSGIRTNPMENLKYFINDNFKQNVKYFKNLLELEVQGKFLQDQTLEQLAKYCKKLKTLRLMDGDNRWLWGKHLADLRSIENLELKSCRNLDPHHLMACSQNTHLKTLNIVECEHLKDIPKMLKLCQHWQYVETLKLTAFTQDQKFLKAILDLPALKLVQFFWINFMPLNFEENLFMELQNHEQKCEKLQHVKFENDRYYIEDESLQNWSTEQYAVIRENVCINGQAWHWSQEVFNKISLSFGLFKNLLTLSFFYCRLLSYEQLKELCNINQNLELIKIYGCPQKEDGEFKKQWLDIESKHKCQLKFESCLSLKEVLNLYEEANSRQFSSFYRREPVMRSIECQFC